MSVVALYFAGFPNSGLEHVSEAKSKRLDRRGGEAASFTREGAVIRDGNRKTTPSHARVGGSEGTDTAGTFPVHPAPTTLERGHSPKVRSQAEWISLAAVRARATSRDHLQRLASHVEPQAP